MPIRDIVATRSSPTAAISCRDQGGTMTTTRNLGRSGLTVSALGLGCMGMSYAYGPTNHAESIATIHRALALGVAFLDTADVYGDGENEELVGEAITGRRDESC